MVSRVGRVNGKHVWPAIGDPLMDLGNSLAYWVEASDDFFIKRMRLQPTQQAGM